MVKPVGYVRAVELLTEKAQIKADGLKSTNVAEQPYQRLVTVGNLGIPVVDAPCNGRSSHGSHGVMGLHAKEVIYLIRRRPGSPARKIPGTVCARQY